ncbi:hypothetical protein Sa4125_16220 [Aureimonas sp. SA4125]|uniref:hypothetical protein n=1 Tax=Aureimonas sp. SA4125 TaxID=2826993 RepID=UPI001CC71A0A|nr:hypothetical protein [Aureimonas sp. SA4125]BDA84080.1 hypothetical protein Sa4125_16220 [Aureimonas sp. SA4125]
MFVVKVETDEALMFRAFRKLSEAKSWAVQSCRRDGDCRADVYGTPGIADELAAAVAVREGRGRLVARGDKLAASDLRNNSNFLVCMGLGTGAGF